MSSPYRESAAASVSCPRCGKPTPPGELAACIDGCGAWVTADAAQTAFEVAELRESRITSWFRERCDCPMCGKQMTLRGHDMSLFQGCDHHGFWVDDSTLTQTGLGRSVMAPRIAQMRAQAKVVRETIARAEAEDRERALAAERAAAARGTTLAGEAAARREAEARAAREAAEARARALRMARRDQLADRVRAAVAGGDVMPIVDELMRLDDAITTLANRLTDKGI